MNEFLSQNGTYLLIVGGITIAGLIVTFFNYKKMKGTAKKFLEQNPTAGKVFLTTKALITSEAVTIHSVNEEVPVLFTENGKSGFYAIPGDIEVEVSYTYTRPGVMYKTVTKSTDLVKKILTIEPNKSYLLGFNKKQEEFTFEELNK